MVAKNKKVVPANEIYLERIYDAPVKTVWDAWNDPAQVAQWWGPRGFTLTTHSKDLRKGGHWHYTMHGPDGVQYINKTKYLEVITQRKLVYDHGGNDEREPIFRVTVIFSELKGERTHMEMRMACATPEAAVQTRQFVRKAGGESTWDRLAEYLERQSSGKEQFVINRSFAAPLETVYEMWTDPNSLARWLAPVGFTMHHKSAPIQAGSSLFYSMTNGAGVTLYGRIEYLAVQRPDRVVYTQMFCDQSGAPSRHPMAPSWPESMLTTVQFTAEEVGTTRVTVTGETHGEVTREELETFVQGRSGMTQGWTGSFDKLEALLAD